MPDFSDDRLFVKMLYSYLGSVKGAFVFWACGALTPEALAEIETDARENTDEMFTKGEGDYTFEMRHVDEDDVPYWEARLICFAPLDRRKAR